MLGDGGPLGVRFFVELYAAALGGGPPDDAHHPGHLLWPHDRDLGEGPQVGEARAEAASAHAVVAGAVGGASDDGDVRHRGVGHRVDHLGAVLGDAALLEVRADDVAGDVVQEQQGHVDLVAQLNELGGFLGGLREQGAVVAQHSQGIAMHPPPAAHQGGAVQRLELLEVGGIDDAGDDLAHVEGDAQVLGDDAQQFLRVVLGRLKIRVWFRPQFAPVEVGDHLPAHADAVQFVPGQVVAQAGDAGVHVPAAKALLIGVLAGGHLHQGRAAEKHPGLLAHEDVVVAHARLVGAPGGGGAEH